jgi:hypothetical protein
MVEGYRVTVRWEIGAFDVTNSKMSFGSIIADDEAIPLLCGEPLDLALHALSLAGREASGLRVNAITASCRPALSARRRVRGSGSRAVIRATALDAPGCQLERAGWTNLAEVLAQRRCVDRNLDESDVIIGPDETQKRCLQTVQVLHVPVQIDETAIVRMPPRVSLAGNEYGFHVQRIEHIQERTEEIFVAREFARPDEHDGLSRAE